MQLPNPKELKALLKVCREFGVTDIKVDTLELKLGDLPRTLSEEETGAIASGPSEEELAFWSAQPDPLAAMLDKQ